MIRNQSKDVSMNRMYKANRQWVFAGAAALALTGGAYMAANTTAHADTVPPTTTVKTATSASTDSPSYAYETSSESHSANSSSDGHGNTVTNNYNESTKTYSNTKDSGAVVTPTVPTSGEYQSSTTTTTVTKNATGGLDTVTTNVYYGNHNSTVSHSTTTSTVASAASVAPSSVAPSLSTTNTAVSDNDSGNDLTTDGSGWTGYIYSDSDATSSQASTDAKSSVAASSVSSDSSASAKSASNTGLPDMSDDTVQKNLNTKNATKTTTKLPKEGTAAYSKALAKLPYFLLTRDVTVVGTQQGTHTVKASQAIRFHLLGAKKLSNGLVRYKVTLLGDVSYITSNPDLFIPAYYGQEGDASAFVGHVNKPLTGVKVLIRHPVLRHSQKDFRDETSFHYHKGDVVKVKRLVRYGRVTRFETADGHYITANVYFVLPMK